MNAALSTQTSSCPKALGDTISESLQDGDEFFHGADP